MKSRLDPKPNYPNLWKLFLICILTFFFARFLVNRLKSVKKWFSSILFFRGYIYNSKQRVAEGDLINWHTLRIQMHLFLDKSDDYIQELTWFYNSAFTQKEHKKTTLPFFGIFILNTFINRYEPNKMVFAIVINLLQPGNV